jgi:hypothetical protein
MEVYNIKVRGRYSDCRNVTLDGASDIDRWRFDVLQAEFD